MPIEIMELVVKATITDREETAKSLPAPSSRQLPFDKEALTEDIVAIVLEILKQQKER